MIRNKTISIIGLLGVALFAIASIVGGLLIENYNVISQYISESYAIDTTYGFAIRHLGYIPSGVLITVFAFLASRQFPESKLIKLGFYGMAVFYGMATIVVGIFPCDSGCNRELIDPSSSQIIHNLAGFLTYSFLPLSIILIGVGLKKSQKYLRLSTRGIVIGVLSFLIIALIFSDPNSAYVGLLQRIVETLFIIWVIFCAIAIWHKN